MKNEKKKMIDNKEFQTLYDKSKKLIDSARNNMGQMANAITVLTSFLLGRYIVEQEQQGSERAKYGAKIVDSLSAYLTEEYGRGFSRSNVAGMRQFYVAYKDREDEIIQSGIGRFEQTFEIIQSGIGQLEMAYNNLPFKLSWTHYQVLMRIENRDERDFYENEAIRSNWNVNTLKRQFHSSLYERLALSRDKNDVMRLTNEGAVPQKPQDILHTPYVLEFAGLEDRASYHESDLESAVIEKMQKFLLELGKGFLFEQRQKRFTFHDKNFYVDLVLYNRLLRCYVLIDFKIDELTHQDLGRSSKANLKDYPKREIQLFKILDGRVETIEALPAKYQELTFSKLFGYYGSKGIVLNERTFEKNLGLRNKDGEYNLLAQLLSDNSHFPLRVSIFEGETKGSNLFSVREFGNNCLLYTLDEVLRYADVLNLIQTDESERVVERPETPLFDNKAFREAIINAILHNLWISGNEPMISVFSNRIEILSRGTLAPAQTMEGFFLGESIPVNEKLSEIFLQLHISEKSGRGVPKIIETYGKEAFTFRENSIVVTIPLQKIKKVGKKVGDKVGNKKGLNSRRQRIITEMRDNPNITTSELHQILGISETAVENNLTFLKENGYVERVGSKKTGYWKVLE